MANGGDDALDLPDEETFVVPAPWRRAGLLPRRGGVRGPALATGRTATAAADELLAELRDGIRAVLRHHASEPELVALAQPYLAGAEATPSAGATVTPTVRATPSGGDRARETAPAGGGVSTLDGVSGPDDPAAGDAAVIGAAVIGAAASYAVGAHDEERLRPLADGWVAAHGPVFAARVIVELSGLHLGNDQKMTGTRVAVSLRRADPAASGWSYQAHWRVLAGRIRAHLAAVDDATYAAARAALASYRDGALRGRLATSFLLPTESDWVARDCASLPAARDRFLGVLLWCSAGTAAQAELTAGLSHPWLLRRDLGLLTTAVEGVGPAIAPLLVRFFDDTMAEDATTKQRMLSVLTALPTDEAMRLLLDRLDQRYVQPVVVEAIRRYPVRAVRLLVEAPGGTSLRARAAAELLRTHVLGNPAAVEAALPLLDEEGRRRVAAIRDSSTLVAAAPAVALPRVLVEPPWTRRRAAKPVVLAGLTRAPEPATIGWAPGEREAWLAAWPHGSEQDRSEQAWAQLAAAHSRGKLQRAGQLSLFTQGPVELARPLVQRWLTWDTWQAEQWMRRVVARFELDALWTAESVARRSPATAAVVLLPYASPALADLMADWLVRSKRTRQTALAWLARHPGVAARALVPAALGKASPARRAAEAALRALAAAGHEDEVALAAKEYGEPAVAALRDLVAMDPLDVLPAKVPALPAWVDVNTLPQVLLRDRSTALPPEAVRHLCTMLAISRPGEVYAGIDVVSQTCDPRSLADFGWALFERWRFVGSPSKENWALQALAWTGDDETARRLAPVIRAWPGEGGHARAVLGLDVLAGIGTDVALMHLHRISQRVRFAGLKERARERIAELAIDLGLSEEQLADRLVPDLGLDANGSLVLDYGPRRFTVGFDEQLKPYVTDADGARRKALPKPGARDDRELAPAAYQRFSGLKKDVRTLATDQIRLLERAMVDRRRWSADEFRRFLVDHPVVWHITRRLVWTTLGADGTAGTAFRVAEDRTLADVADDLFTLDGDAGVGIAHPVSLGEALPAWSELFADYEILQPFPQLGRGVHRLTEEEAGATRLSRFEGVTVPTGTLLGLERRGWERGAPQDAGIQGWLERALPGGRTLVAVLDPGIAIGAIDALPEQRLTEIWVTAGSVDLWRPGKREPLGDLDPITASELLRDLTEVTR